MPWWKMTLGKKAEGKINKDSELFGPASGNGFQELAAYAQDKNGRSLPR